MSQPAHYAAIAVDCLGLLHAVAYTARAVHNDKDAAFTASCICEHQAENKQLA